MEDILINEPLVDAFWGRQQCSFCNLQLLVNDPTSVLAHFIMDHMVLLDAYFSCPACMLPTIVHSENYPSHFHEHHAHTTAFMFILSETSVHSRMQHALALTYFITMGQLLHIKLLNEPNLKYASAFGGYSLSCPDLLKEEILDHQSSLLPRPEKKQKPKHSGDTHTGHSANPSTTCANETNYSRKLQPPSPKNKWISKQQNQYHIKAQKDMQQYEIHCEIPYRTAPSRYDQNTEECAPGNDTKVYEATSEHKTYTPPTTDN